MSKGFCDSLQFLSVNIHSLDSTPLAELSIVIIYFRNYIESLIPSPLEYTYADQFSDFPLECPLVNSFASHYDLYQVSIRICISH
jgi:hypothetical protein